MMRMRKLVRIAALLHDIGKMSHRGKYAFKRNSWVEIENEIVPAVCPENEKGEYTHRHAAYSADFYEFFQQYIECLSEEEKSDLDILISKHHLPLSETKEELQDAMRFIQYADRLAAATDRTEEKSKEEYWLYSPFCEQCIYEIDVLKLENIFPLENKTENPEMKYKNLCMQIKNKVVQDGVNIKSIKDIDRFTNQFLHFLEVYATFVPSTSMEKTQCSLYDHLKLTAVLADAYCEGATEMLHVVGDLSGIQDFVFRQLKTKEIKADQGSKMLRGRSFYLQILQDVLARYILNEFDLSLTNLLFAKGGNFIIEIPKKEDTVNKLEEIVKEINEWLWYLFYGNLILVVGYSSYELRMEEGSGGLADKFRVADEKARRMIEERKSNKLSMIVKDTNFFQIEDVNECPICKLPQKTVVDDRCDRCKQFEEIGSFLPKCSYIVFAKNPVKGATLKGGVKLIKFDKFGVVYLLSDKRDAKEFLKHDDVIDVLSLNKPDGIFGIYCVGNAVPIANIKFKNEKGFEEAPDTVLSLDTISEMSLGDKKIGYLKIDMDNLGITLREVCRKLRLSAYCTFIRFLDYFFSGYLNLFCKEYSKNTDLLDKKYFYKLKEENAIYLVFAGGDDIMLIGPASCLPDFAVEFNDKFKEFCSCADFSISCGIVFERPHLPVLLASEEAGRALMRSKEEGKNRLTLFDAAITWEEFKELKIKDFTLEMKENIEQKKISRNLLYFLLKARKIFGDGNRFHAFVPLALYHLVRNVKEEVRERLKECLLTSTKALNMFKYLKIPVCWTLMLTRRGHE